MAENPLLPASYDFLWAGIIVALVALLVWALVSIYRSPLDPREKLAWALVAFLLPIIGPIVWLVRSRSLATRQ